MDKPVSKDPHNKGFALVVALSLMILLTVVAVGLLTLSSISLRSSSQGVAQAAAQANARMALMIAIGELQKQLGPDQRVSANGAILATTTVQHPNWAGVWNSWQAGTQAAGTTSPDTPSEHRTILGAGNNGMSPTYEAQRGDHFRAWLVSLSQNQAADISSAMSLSLTGTAKPSATDNAVQLVGLKSLGPEANVADHVKVGLLPIQSSGSATTASGRYGWWVGDESQKARIMGDSYKLNPTSTLADRLFRHTAPGSTGTVVAKGLEAVTDETRLGNLPTLETMNLLEGATGKPSRNFHNVTPFSRAVLADVREGGLKRDLTTLLERPIDPDEVYNYTTVNLGPPFKRVTSLKPKADDFMLYRFDSGTGEAAVPVQDLAAYYQLYDSSRPTGRDGMKYSSSPVSNLLPNGLQVPAPDYGNNTDTSKYLRNYTTLYRRPVPVKVQFLLGTTAVARTAAEITSGPARRSSQVRVRAMAVRATAAGSCGWLSTSGLPLSPPSRSFTSNGIWPSSGTFVPSAEVSCSATSDPPPNPKRSIGSPQCGHGKLLMFSMTPATFWWVCSARVPARTATSAAAACGVVTTTISAFGSNCAVEIAMSPVPGGRSRSRTSRSPHQTSARNC